MLTLLDHFNYDVPNHLHVLLDEISSVNHGDGNQLHHIINVDLLEILYSSSLLQSWIDIINIHQLDKLIGLNDGSLHTGLQHSLNDLLNSPD